MTAVDLCVFTFLPLSYGVSWVVSRFLVGRSVRIRKLLEVDRSSRQTTIDGLRGLLSMTVVVAHLLPNYLHLRAGVWPPVALRYPETVGESGVVIFFMISAYLFWGRVLDRGAKMKWGEYFVGRVFRLTPLYLVFVAALVALALGRTGGRLVEPVSEFARHVGAWLAYTVHTAPNVNHMRTIDTTLTVGLVWSLVYEWLFYLSLPVLALLFWRGRPFLPAAIAGAVLVGLYQLSVHHSHWLLTSRLWPFGPGMLVAWLVRQNVVRRLAERRWFGVVAVLSVAGVAALAPTGYDLRGMPFLTLFFLAVACNNPLFGFLRGTAARWLGEISYGTYLFHMMSLWLMEVAISHWFFGGRDPALWVHFVVLVTVAGGLILLCSATHLAIERPGIAMGRKVARKLRPSAPAV